MSGLFHSALLLAAQSLKESLVYWISEYSYVGVFLFLLACGLGFPSPEEVALVGGGYAVYLDDPESWPKILLMVAVALSGVLLGDVILYFIGRRVGERPERVPFVGRHLTERRMRRARALFRRHGAKAVFFGRFLFGIRAVTFFVSGSLRVPLGTFVLMDGLAALLTVPASVILAWWFGGQLHRAFDAIGQLDRVVLLVVAGGVCAVGVAWLRRRRQRLAELDERLANEESATELGAVTAGEQAPQSPLATESEESAHLLE